MYRPSRLEMLSELTLVGCRPLERDQRNGARIPARGWRIADVYLVSRSAGTVEGSGENDARDLSCSSVGSACHFRTFIELGDERRFSVPVAVLLEHFTHLAEFLVNDTRHREIRQNIGQA